LREVHASVGHQLLRRGEVLRAGESFIAAGDMDGLRLALRAACTGGIAATPVDVLGLWWEALDEPTRATAEGRLLEALLLRAAEPYSDRCVAAVTGAIQAARAAGDVGLEIAGMWEFGFVARGRGEVERILDEVPRVMELEAAGDERAVPLATLARTLIGDALGQYDEAEQGLLGIDRSRVPAGWQPSIDYLLMTFAYRRGDPVATDAAAASWLEVAPADFPLRALFGPWMDWIHGRTPDWDSLPVPSEVPGSTDADRVWTCPAFGIMYANSCRLADARRAVIDAEASAAGIVLPSTLAMITGCRAALAVAEGDEDLAAALLVDTLGADDDQVGLYERALRQILAIAYVLHPAMREHWDAVPLGPIHERSRHLARAVRAVRSGSMPPPIDADTLAHVGTLLPLRWGVELACAAAVDDPLAAREMLERLVDAHGEPTRTALRACKGSALPAVAKGAAKLLASVPIGVSGVVLGVLGPTELVVDGTPADGADWRRAKVRALACLMAIRRRVRRDEVVDLLWPDLDVDAGRHNLRVTLNYLQRLFEPHRRSGEAPFHLRLEGEWLRLLDPPHVRVDAEEFLDSVERADRLRAEGRLEAASVAYRRAMDRWRGECLADVVLEDWSQASVARLVSRGAEAGVALASLLLALGEPADAIDAAYRALQIDRWSEPAHRLVVASHLARGDRPAAQRALDDCLGMLDELGVPPSPETASLGRRLASVDGPPPG
jgi:DNA-binding SARP family transcriptional activator